MKAYTKAFTVTLFVGALFAMTTAAILLAAGALATGAGAQTSGGKVHWNLRLNETRGPIRTADMSAPSGKEALSEILGGPASGSDNAYLIYTRMAAGARGPSLFTLPVEHDYVVLSGKMTVQIGMDKFVAGPYMAVVIPPNTPHTTWNAESEPEADFEVISAANPQKELGRDLMSMVKAAKATKVENAANSIREIKLLSAAEMKPGLNGQVWTDRSKGSPFQLRLDNTLVGNGNTRTHVHIFEQVYFGTEGDMSLTYGLENFIVKKGDVGIVPAGVVHANAATTPVERHLVMLLPQLPAGQPADIEYEKKAPPPAAGR